MRQPLGVIGIIYESRPNVTIDAAALCLKSGTLVFSEAAARLFILIRLLPMCIETGLRAGPEVCVQIARTADRDFVGAMIGGKYPMCDVIIPRGGKGLIERAVKTRVFQ